MTSLKNAWLIGIYSNEMECRIKRLGYELVRYFPDLNVDLRTESAPQLIVFSEDQFQDVYAMQALRPLYPEAILISLSLYLPSEPASCHKPTDPQSNYSHIRLLKSIEVLGDRNQWRG